MIDTDYYQHLLAHTRRALLGTPIERVRAYKGNRKLLVAELHAALSRYFGDTWKAESFD